MADIILHRRSFDTGSVPTTHSLGVAQFAINVPDGKVFIHKSSSLSQSIVSVVTTDSITTGSITLTGTASAGLFVGQFSGSFSGVDTTLISSGSASAAIKYDVSGSSSLQINTDTAISGGLYVSLYSGSTAITGTNIFGTASFANTAVTASYVESRYIREWHVSAQSAYETGSGDLLRPFRTIAEAIAAVTVGEQIIIHPGTYDESFNTPTNCNNVTFTAANTEIGGLINITGTASIDQTVATIRLVGLNLGSVIHSGTRNLYVQNCTVNGAFSKTGTGYLEVNNSTAQSGATSITGAGSVVIYNSLLGVVTVNNASAVVNLSNNITMVTPTCQAGTLAIDGGYAYSTTNTTGAVFGSAGAVVALKDLQCITPSSTLARITLNGSTFTSIQNVAYDRVNSVTGSSLGTRAQFQQIQAEGMTGSLLGSITSAETASYANPGFKIGSASFQSYRQNTTVVGSYLWPFPTGSSNGATLVYTVASGSNARTGQVLIAWANRTASYTETTTLDIGNTSGVTVSCSLATVVGDIQQFFYFPSVSWSLSLLTTLL